MADIWVVCCKDLHAALGPFANEASAILAASETTSTDAEGCIYVPVPFYPFLKKGEEKKDTKDWRGGHTYL